MNKLLILLILMITVKTFSQVSVPNLENVSEDAKIYEDVADKTEYPGGLDAFRRNFAQTFNSGNINRRVNIKSEAVFVIDQAVYITDINIIGDNKSMNKEMRRAINAMSKTKWTPRKDRWTACQIQI